MAMTTCSLYGAASSTFPKQTTVRLPGSCVYPHVLPSSLKFTARPSFSSATAVSAAATSAVEAEPQKKAAAASKVLPFRVGHGFDLHRLEPGYPLIIGGINIPHDRGCEAHSDVSEDEINSTLISQQLISELGFCRGETFSEVELWCSVDGKFTKLSQEHVGKQMFKCSGLHKVLKGSVIPVSSGDASKTDKNASAVVRTS